MNLKQKHINIKEEKKIHSEGEQYFVRKSM